MKELWIEIDESLSEEEKNKVFGKNAANLLGLS